MINIAKNKHHSDEQDKFENRRRPNDRRTSNEKVRFPFIDDDCKLVMKDRRNADRRQADVKLKDKSLKVVSKFLKK